MGQDFPAIIVNIFLAILAGLAILIVFAVLVWVLRGMTREMVALFKDEDDDQMKSIAPQIVHDFTSAIELDDLAHEIVAKLRGSSVHCCSGDRTTRVNFEFPPGVDGSIGELYLRARIARIIDEEGAIPYNVGVVVEDGAYSWATFTEL